MKYDIFKLCIFPYNFYGKDKKYPFWAVTFKMYDKSIKLKVLHLSLTIIVGLNVAITTCKFKMIAHIGHNLRHSKVCSFPYTFYEISQKGQLLPLP